MRDRIFFNLAAAFNFLVGLPLVVAPAPMAGLFDLQLGTAGTLFMQITGLAVAGFGIVYGLIARDPTRYRALVPVGAALKFGVVALIYGYWLSGAIAWKLPALAFGDIVFGSLFILRFRRLGSSSTD